MALLARGKFWHQVGAMGYHGVLVKSPWLTSNGEAGEGTKRIRRPHTVG